MWRGARALGRWRVSIDMRREYSTTAPSLLFSPLPLSASPRILRPKLASTSPSCRAPGDRGLPARRAVAGLDAAPSLSADVCRTTASPPAASPRDVADVPLAEVG